MTESAYDIDRAIIAATQDGLPLVPRPFDEIARSTRIAPELLMERLRRMRETGAVRRIAAVPNHYALGLTANGMTVWNVDDGELDRLGPAVGQLDFVSHCYRRPRHLPDWPYNLFAMVHGRNRDEVSAKTAKIAHLLGDAARERDVLFSSEILKKTGFRLLA